MPKNRQHIPRAERTGELLTAATELFLKHGFDRTTVAEIASAAGVATANVYWYYPSKDDVFAAVMDRLLSREIRALEYELRSLDPMSTLSRGLTDMRPFRSLHQAMHHRMGESKPVAAAHQRLIGWVRSMVDRVLDEQSSSHDRALISDIAITLFEGANVSDPPLRTAHEMIRTLLESVSAPAGERLG